MYKLNLSKNVNQKKKMKGYSLLVTWDDLKNKAIKKNY